MRPNPKTRDDLQREELGAMLRVSDPSSGSTLDLEPMAACVFRHADGSRTVAELTTLLRSGPDADATEQGVWEILDALADAGLMSERAAPPSGETLSRRVLFRYAAAAGVAAVVVAGSDITALAKSAKSAKSDKSGKSRKSIKGGKGAEQGAKKKKKAAEQRVKKSHEQKKKLAERKAAEEKKKVAQKEAVEQKKKLAHRKAAEQKKKVAEKKAAEQRQKKSAEAGRKRAAEQRKKRKGGGETKGGL